MKAALDQAKGDPGRQLKLAVQFRDDKSLPTAERLRAINFILRLARLGREERRSSKGSTFRVVRHTPGAIHAGKADMILPRFDGHLG